MRSSSMRSVFRLLDHISSILSVLALVLIYNHVSNKHETGELWQREVSSNSPSLPDDAKNIMGKLPVQVWSNVCGGKLFNLLNSPFFPRFFDELYFISNTRIHLNRSNYGQRVFGYLHPPETGYYKFVLYSDDGSEFWFGANQSLGSLKIASSVATRDRVGSAPVGEICFDSQISDDFLLEKGNKYPLEIIHLQGTGADFVELHWIRPGKHYLEVITSEYISHSVESQSVSQITSSKGSSNSQLGITKPYLVSFLTDSAVERTLSTCSYTLPTATKPGMRRLQGNKAIQEIITVTNDDRKWQENEEAKLVVDLFVAGLEKIFPKKYLVERILTLERMVTNEENNVVLYFLEIELSCDALDYPERVAEYVYLQNNEQGENPRGKNAQLCYPKGLDWKKEVAVHLIIAVDCEGQRLHRFIERAEQILQGSLEVDFQLVVIHSGKLGLDVERTLQTTSLQKYKVEKLNGEFSWTRAINAGVRLVRDAQSIVLTTDVYMDLAPEIFENCRKHCIGGRMAFAPILFSLKCGAFPAEPYGSWDDHGYQMIGMYKSDWNRLGGLNEGTADHLAAWDLMDRILSSGMYVARVKSPNLFRLFYPKPRDLNVPEF